MLTYVLINFFIILFSLIFAYKKQGVKDKNDQLLDIIYLSSAGILLLMLSGFRGSFTSDYKGYSDLFHFYNTFGFKELFHYHFGQEIGYVILNRIIGIFTSNSVYLMFITSLMIISLFFKEIKKYSAYIWLSVLMFVTIGAYYSSFNIIRQIMAAAIIFAGSKYLYDRRPIKYFLVVLLAATFHKTALVMLLFYFVLNFRFSIKKLGAAIFILFISMTFLDTIISIAQKFYYSYYTVGGYGMTGYGFKNIVLPLAVLAFVLIHLNVIDTSNHRTNIWINAVIFYAFFSVLGIKIQMLQRFAEFFTPYALLLVPQILSQIRSKELKVMYAFTAIVLLISYNYVVLSGTGYDPYYFIWNVR